MTSLTNEKPLDADIWLRDPQAMQCFYNELLEYIVNKVWSRAGQSRLQKQTIREYLLRSAGSAGHYSEEEYEALADTFDDEPADPVPIFEVERIIKLAPLTFESIAFPANDARLGHNYIALLENLNSIRFTNCSFYTNQLELQHTSICFDRCIFFTDWNTQIPAALHDFETLYQECTFKACLNINGRYCDPVEIGRYRSLLRDCALKQVLISKIEIDSKLFENSSNYQQRIESLEIHSAKLKRSFILRKTKAERIFFSDTTFSSKFELKDCIVREFKSDNTNFKQVSDFNSSRFLVFFIYKSVFFDFAALENCQFGYSEDSSREQEESAGARLTYATFYSFINFRNSTFHRQLDLRNSNRKELPNFLGCTFKPDACRQTDRETFRIIKHSFDMIGNRVDANRYYALEMQAYLRELKEQGSRSERFILWCNGWMSNYGQSYIRPIVLIMLCMLFMYGIRTGYEGNWLYEIHPPANPIISLLAGQLNGWSKSLAVFKPLMLEGMEFVSLLFGVIFSALIWQAVVAIKRHTVR